MADETPLYTLTADAFVGAVYRKAGEIVAYDGVPGEHMEPANVAAKDPAARAALAREQALIRPDAHIGGPSVTGSAITPEVNAAMQALGPDDVMTPAEIAAEPTPDTSPTKAQQKAADKKRGDKADADADAAKDARADAAADAAAGAVQRTLSK